MSLSPEVIGRIILARFLSFPLKQYWKEINKMKTLPLYNKISPAIIFKKFSHAGILKGCNKCNSNILGKIIQEGEYFSILYQTSWFAGEFHLDRDKLKKLHQTTNFKNLHNNKIDSIMRKLRLISTRNRITHMILNAIIEHQIAFFHSHDPLKITPLSQVSISRWIKNHGYQWIDNSMISRVINDSLIITPNGYTMKVKDFFLNTRDVYKKHIKEILIHEENQIRSNLLTQPFTDEEIRILLKELYNLNVLRRTVSYCRSQMGVAPYYRRIYNNLYPPDWTHFSSYFPMNLTSMKENIPELSGVYELSITDENIQYPLKPAGVFYIGSSKNIRKRLRTHLGGWSKNEILNKFLNKNKCFFQVFYM